MKRMTWPAASDDFLEDRLQPLLELAAVLRAGDERAHVERDDLLVLQPLGHVLPDDALGEPFDDRRLADARLADEHRVVLRAAREHLDHAADLVVSADDRIELALARELGEVAAVALERLIGRLRILAGDALRPAHARHRLEDRVLGDAALLEEARRRRAPAFGGDRDEEVLGAGVLVLEPLGFLLGGRRAPAAGARRSPPAIRRARAAADSARRGPPTPAPIGSGFILRTISGTTPSFCSRSVSRRCSGRISACPSRSASCCAARIASCAFSVYLLIFIFLVLVGPHPRARSRARRLRAALGPQALLSQRFHRHLSTSSQHDLLF